MLRLPSAATRPHRAWRSASVVISRETGVPGLRPGSLSQRSRPQQQQNAAHHRSSRHGAVCRAASEDDEAPAFFTSSQEEEPAPTAYRTLEALSQKLDTIMDTNTLQTALTAALRAEQYSLAARVRDRIKEVTGGLAARIDWASLGLPNWVTDRAERLGYRFPTEVQRRAAPVIGSGLDCVICSETGSGKTLSFLVPALSRLDYPPTIFTDDLQGPQAIIVVPTLELGVQCALTVFKMYGGNVSQGKPGDAANMFTYTGPRGIKVRGLLNKEEVAMARGTDYLKGVHVVVGTPAALMEVYGGDDRKPILDYLRVLVVDEYDECLKVAPEALTMLLSCAVRNNKLPPRPVTSSDSEDEPSAASSSAKQGSSEGRGSSSKPQVVLVGATVTPGQVSMACTAGWIREPVVLNVGPEATTGKPRVPPGLVHKYLVCEPSRRLAVLARLLRRELSALGDDPMQPARAMVFATSIEEAAAATEPLTSALWGDHRLAVLLPPGTRVPPPPSFSGGPGTSLPAMGPDDVGSLVQDGDDARNSTAQELAGASPFAASDPIRALHSFRDNRTSLLLCTPAASRGLDLPAVSHVYNIGLPEDATQYLHRAGRAGRIGSTQGGVVTTLVAPSQVAELQVIAEQLGIQLVQDEEPQPDALLPPGVASLLVEGEEEEGEGQKEGAGAGEGQKGKDVDVEKLRRGLEDLFNLM